MSGSQKFAKAWDAAEASHRPQTVVLSGVSITITVQDGSTKFSAKGQPVSEDYIRILVGKED